MPRTCQVPNIFQNDDKRLSLVEDVEDVVEERSARFFHTELRARFGKRLTRKSSGKNLMPRNVDSHIVRERRDISQWIHPPVALIDPGSIGVDLHCTNTFTASDVEYSVKAADSGKKINKVKSACHVRSLAIYCHSKLQLKKFSDALFDGLKPHSSNRCTIGFVGR